MNAVISETRKAAKLGLHSGKNAMLKTSTNSLDLRKIACLTFKNVRAQKILILSTF